MVAETTNKTEVEGKCSSKIFDHSCLFANILLGFYWRKHLFFFRWKNLLVNSLSKHFVFPAKKLRKNTGIRITHALVVYFSTTPVWKWLNFPAKRLRKIRVPKIRMRRCFFFPRCDIFFLQSNKSYFVLSGLLFICSINKLNKIDFFVIFYFLFIVSSKAIQHTRTTIVFHFNMFIQLKIF